MSKAKENETRAMPTIEEMFDAGVHYGYKKSRRHPSISSYVYATKNNGDIIDIEKTSILLNKACEFIKELGAKKKVVLFVGTKPEAKELIKSAAESLDMPYVIERWIGGTLSNFPEIKKRISVLETYHKDSKDGELNKYTKKERSTMAKKIEKLNKYYGGLLDLKKTPDAIFIIDAKQEHIAATEARKGSVPVISLINSDSNMKNIEYPIVGNDASIPAIELVISTIVNSYKEGLMSVPTIKEA